MNAEVVSKTNNTVTLSISETEYIFNFSSGIDSDIFNPEDIVQIVELYTNKIGENLYKEVFDVYKDDLNLGFFIDRIRTTSII